MLVQSRIVSPALGSGWCFHSLLDEDSPSLPTFHQVSFDIPRSPSPSLVGDLDLPPFDVDLTPFCDVRGVAGEDDDLLGGDSLCFDS